MRKQNLLVILASFMVSILTAQLFLSQKSIPKNHLNHQKYASKMTSFPGSNKITPSSKNKLSDHNLSAVADYTNIATIILGVINDNYFGYGWQMTPDGAVDNDFETLWKMIYPNANGNFNNPGITATASELATSLNALGEPAAAALLTKSMGTYWGQDQLPIDNNFGLNYLQPDHAFYLNMIANENNLENDVTSLYTLANNNYFGYTLNTTTDNLYTIVFGSDQANPTVQTQAQITTSLKLHGVHLKTFLETYLNDPGTSTTDLARLKASWFRTELTAQNNKLKNDANSLFNLLINNYFGYTIENVNDPLFPILFGSDPANPTIQSSAQISDLLKSQKANLKTFLASYLKTPGTVTTDINDLVDGSWFKTELTTQNNELTLSVNTLYEYVTQWFFGYPCLSNDPLFTLLMQGTYELPGQSHSKDEIKQNLKSKKGGG